VEPSITNTLECCGALFLTLKFTVDIYYYPPLTLPSALNVSYMNIHAETNILSAFSLILLITRDLLFFYLPFGPATSFYKLSTNRGASLENLRYTK